MTNRSEIFELTHEQLRPLCAAITKLFDELSAAQKIQPEQMAMAGLFTIGLGLATMGVLFDVLVGPLGNFV